ncbi:ferric reductase-like transmembrane domain-containing protein [Paracoccus aurantius]
MVAAESPLLAWRRPVYIIAGFSGIVAMCLLLLQPLLAAGHLPGFRGGRGRRAHRWTGATLVMLVLVHVAGLWITSPPDVIDALLFVSPTPFSVWGVMAMWAIFLMALLAIRQRRSRSWHLGHRAAALVVIVGSVVHALLIEGAMEPLTKAVLCAFVLVASLLVIFGHRIRAPSR